MSQPFLTFLSLEPRASVCMAVREALVEEWKTISAEPSPGAAAHFANALRFRSYIFEPQRHRPRIL